MKELIEDANAVGLSDLDIAKRVGVAQSTVRNWFKTNNGDKKYAIKLYQLTNQIESGKSIDLSAQKDDKKAKLERWLEEGKQYGLNYSVNMPISAEELKEIILRRMKI
jgi:transposase